MTGLRSHRGRSSVLGREQIDATRLLSHRSGRNSLPLPGSCHPGLKAQAVGSSKGGGGGAVAVGGDQVGDVALIGSVVQAPRTCRDRFRGPRQGW
jgi:hypothetical protein